MTRAESLRRMKTSVRRDLEWLLNSHFRCSRARKALQSCEVGLQLRLAGHLSLNDMANIRNRTDLARLMETMVAILSSRGCWASRFPWRRLQKVRCRNWVL